MGNLFNIVISDEGKVLTIGIDPSGQILTGEFNLEGEDELSGFLSFDGKMVTLDWSGVLEYGIEQNMSISIPFSKKLCRRAYRCDVCYTEVFAQEESALLLLFRCLQEFGPPQVVRMIDLEMGRRNCSLRTLLIQILHEMILRKLMELTGFFAVYFPESVGNQDGEEMGFEGLFEELTRAAEMYRRAELNELRGQLFAELGQLVEVPDEPDSSEESDTSEVEKKKTLSVAPFSDAELEEDPFEIPPDELSRRIYGRGFPPGFDFRSVPVLDLRYNPDGSLCGDLSQIERVAAHMEGGRVLWDGNGNGKTLDVPNVKVTDKVEAMMRRHEEICST
jgi:hypothetical protein